MRLINAPKRYYNPVLARFISADSVVPGDASGGMDGVALKGLTVDFHEPGFVASLAQENQRAFWFQMSGEEQQRAGRPWGPANPQALNRYSYVLNNPIKHTDPTGHWTFSVGLTFQLGAALGGTISSGITWDTKSNVKSYSSTSLGGTVGAAVGVSLGSSVTTASTIYETAGKGAQYSVNKVSWYRLNNALQRV